MLSKKQSALLKSHVARDNPRLCNYVVTQGKIYATDGKRMFSCPSELADGVYTPDLQPVDAPAFNPTRIYTGSPLIKASLDAKITKTMIATVITDTVAARAKSPYLMPRDPTIAVHLVFSGGVVTLNGVKVGTCEAHAVAKGNETIELDAKYL
jgi:hypothetical protein